MVGAEVRKPSLATLAAAIIQTRGSAQPADILAAIQEADWALFPENHVGSADYKAWHTSATILPPRDVRDMSDEELQAMIDREKIE